MATTTLSINFYNATITDELKNEFMQAINHELAGMNIESLNDSISRLEKQASSIQKDIDDNGDDEAGTKQKKLDGINATISDNKDTRTKCEESQAQTLDIYNKVVSAMSEKNKDHFGNSKDVVRTVLRVLATWDNSKLMKYAIIPAFQSPALYEALETIHITSKANENGELSMTMQIYKALNTELIHNKEFRMGSIILQLDNKMILVCNKFNHSRKYNLELTVWLPTENKWVRTYTKNEYTEMMWDYYRKHQQKRNHNFRKYENMMKHERRHKGGGGGSRIYNGSITDYECSSNPLHDFRRCYN